jgi:hypothetical protein
VEVEIDPHWRKSSRSSGNGGACVEAGNLVSRVLVRDSKDSGHGLVLSFTSDAWRTFLSKIKRLDTRQANSPSASCEALGLLCRVAA